MHSCSSLQQQFRVATDPPSRGWTLERLKKLWKSGALQTVFADFVVCEAGCQSSMLLGRKCALPVADRPADYGTPAWGAAAAGVLRGNAAFVGLQERWNESVELFATLYGGSYPPEAYENSRPGRFPDFEDKLAELARRQGDPADETLYAAAVAWFDDARACAGLAAVEGGDAARLAACAAVGVTPAGPLPAPRAVGDSSGLDPPAAVEVSPAANVSVVLDLRPRSGEGVD